MSTFNYNYHRRFTTTSNQYRQGDLYANNSGEGAHSFPASTPPATSMSHGSNNKLAEAGCYSLNSNIASSQQLQLIDENQTFRYTVAHDNVCPTLARVVLFVYQFVQ